MNSYVAEISLYPSEKPWYPIIVRYLLRQEDETLSDFTTRAKGHCDEKHRYKLIER